MTSEAIIGDWPTRQVQDSTTALIVAINRAAVNSRLVSRSFFSLRSGNRYSSFTAPFDLQGRSTSSISAWAEPAPVGSRRGRVERKQWRDAIGCRAAS